MAIQVSWFNETGESGAPAYDAQALRNLMTAIFSGPSSVAGGTRSAVRYTDGSDLQVYGTGTYEVRVRPGMAVIEADGTGQGAYVFRSDGTVSLTLPTADPTNSRIDVVYAQVFDDDVDGGGTKGGTIGFVQGTATAVPSPMAIPDNAVKLAEVTVPPAGGALVVSDRREWFAGPGGIIRTTSAQRPSLQAPTGSLVYESDTGKWVAKNNSGQWGTIFDPQATWTDITSLNSNYVWQSGKQGQWRRNGDLVTLRGEIRRSSGLVNLNGTEYDMFTLPEGARPNRTMFAAGGANNGLPGGPTIRWDIRANGTVAVFGQPAQSAAQWVSIDCISFYVN